MFSHATDLSVMLKNPAILANANETDGYSSLDKSLLSNNIRTFINSGNLPAAIHSTHIILFKGSEPYLSCDNSQEAVTFQWRHFVEGQQRVEAKPIVVRPGRSSQRR